MKAVRRIQMKFTHEDGRVDRKVTAIMLDVEDFAIELPEYVRQALACDKYVRDPLQAKAVQKFEKAMTDYEAWIKSAKAEPVIILHAQLKSHDRRLKHDRKSDRNGVRHDIDREAYFLERNDRAEQTLAISFSYEFAYRVNGRIYDRRLRPAPIHSDEPDTWEVGMLKVRIDSGSVILDHTPDLQQRIERICGALDGAARKLNEICGAKDVAAALLAAPGLALLPAPAPKVEAKGKARRAKR